MPVQEGSGTGGSGGMVGHLHPCLGFPLPPGTPTILPTTYYPRLSPLLLRGTQSLSLEGFYNAHGRCYFVLTTRQAAELEGNVAQWLEKGSCRVGQPPKLHKGVRGGFLRPPPGGV